MRSSRSAFPFSLLLAMVLSGVVSPPGRSVAEAAPPNQAEFYPRPAFFQMSATCATDLTPDQAVILGGASSSALKPEDAIAQLEKELALMRSYIAEKHGELQLLERVRTLKNPQPGREDADPPFQVIQRLQVTLPADAPVDAILQNLIELGFDRFGDNVLNNYNRREAVIRFRNTTFDAKLKDFQQRCTATAWKQWCATPEATGNCSSDTPPQNIELQTFNVHSKETLMRPDGVSAAWQLSVNRFQRTADPPDLLGNVTVHLEGNIVLTFHRDETHP